LDIKPLLYTSLFLMMPLFAEASTVQIVQGAAGDSNELPATSPSPGLAGGVITFSNLSSLITANCTDNLVCPTFNPNQYASQGVTISSPDGLVIYPFSTQTAGGIELFDPGATNSSTCVANGDCDGTANITISLTNPVNDLAVGITEFDDLPDPPGLTIEALGAGGVVLDSADVAPEVNAAESAVNTGNTYFVAEDSTPGIYGIEIKQTTATFGSGLALSEVEYSPEPSTVLLLIGGGLAIIGSSRLRKKG